MLDAGFVAWNELRDEFAAFAVFENEVTCDGAGFVENERAVFLQNTIQFFVGFA